MGAKDNINKVLEIKKALDKLGKKDPDCFTLLTDLSKIPVNKDSSTNDKVKKKAKILIKDWMNEMNKPVSKKEEQKEEETPNVQPNFELTAPLPIRNSKGIYVFEDRKEFKPNKSPKEVLQAGSFGGTYFRPIYSSVTKLKYGSEKVLNIKTQVASPIYDASKNKYKVKCGGSLEMWEESGWIKEQDPYGWFQWYCRTSFSPDDDRQIDRWSKCCGEKGRWKNNLITKIYKAAVKYDNAVVSPVIRQVLLHWGYELTEEDYKKRVKTDQMKSVYFIFHLYLIHLHASIKKDINLAGIFPIDGIEGWQGGRACLPAVEMALKDVNEINSLLPGYNLKLYMDDSECDSGKGAAVLYDLLYNKPQKVILLAGCSTVCTTVAEAAKMWNLVTICYGASSPALSNRQGSDARIIVGLFYAKAARRVLCEIYKQKLFGPKYVWFYIGWYEDDWFMKQKYLDEDNINCTIIQMAEAAEGHFSTESLMKNQDTSLKTISGNTVADFEYKLNLKLMQIAKYERDVKYGIMPEGYLEAPLAYDAVWAIALALNQTMERLAQQGKTIEDYNYDNNKIAKIILEEIADVKFTGISGEVAFSEKTGDRIAWTKVEQLQKGKYEVVGFYDQKTDNLTWLIPKYGMYGGRTDRVIWSSKKIPQDRTIVKMKLMKLNLYLYISMIAVSTFGIIFAISLIIFNFKYSHRRIIQHSHPSCNNLMLVGVIFCLLATIPIGLDGRYVSPKLFPLACGSGTWLLTLGFSLAYGAMFSKIWRVHRLTAKHKDLGETIKTVVIPWKLWAAVGFLMLIDLIILTVWSIVDPLQREVRNFSPLPSPNPEEDVVIQPQLEHCKSKHHHVWLGIMYTYKGLQLILGLFLSYEIRSVKVKQINDTRLVGMSIYNVVVLCMITAPVTLVIGDQQNASFAFVSLANVFCCFLSMALIFVPKIHFIHQHAHDPREKEDDEKKNTAEQELKYKNILKENEDLQKKIADRDQKINCLRKRITEKKSEQEAAAKAVGASAITANNNSCRLRPLASNVKLIDTSGSSVSELDRQESLKGITVYRGIMPTDGRPAPSALVVSTDEPVESLSLTRY
ncbi:GABBR [Lepeophtheirus salmonis]|uniref:GABBR n=1 Tax=Lepeophtheirus salmonis TaxID=72036 RepID=A0A7R8CXN7_LEPSM|nr:GABBR [Lepeophtheirus salmonis]CAF2964529.1 GABBR [Lepeophtheirus salmonis]